MMPIYMVERVMPGATVAQVEALQATAERICREARAQGRAISYLGSTYTPGESRCRCVFESSSADEVREVNDTADLPYSRIVIAVDLPGSGRQPFRPDSATLSTTPAHEGDAR
jgi:hypothetical protein